MKRRERDRKRREERERERERERPIEEKIASVVITNVFILDKEPKLTSMR
jgi:hypothetical protein